MSMRNDRYPSLDPLLEGYLEYLADVARKARGTVRDVRCTLRRVSQVMERLAPERPLWKLGLSDYLRWIEEERVFGRGGASLNKNLSHLRGFLDYAWRSGRADRNVLDQFQIQDDGKRKEPESLSIEEAVQIGEVLPCVDAGRTSRPDGDFAALRLRITHQGTVRPAVAGRRHDAPRGAGAGGQGRSATDGAFAGDGLYGVVGLSLGAWREARPAAANGEVRQGRFVREGMFARWSAARPSGRGSSGRSRPRPCVIPTRRT